MNINHYFNREGNQIKHFPKAWMDLSRFQVGQNVRYLRSKLVYVGPPLSSREYATKPEHWYDMQGAVGAIVKIHDGVRYDTEMTISESVGWISVCFPRGAGYGFEKDDTPKSIALRMDAEGENWETVT